MEKNNPHLSWSENKGTGLSRLSLLFTVLLVTASLAFTSCKKKEKEETNPATEDTEQATANDNNIAEAHAADIESMGSQVADNGSLSTYRTNGTSQLDAMESSPCATITASGQIITIDFGTTGCTGRDGRTRTGKLIYNFSGSASGAVHYRNPGFNMTVSSQNYVVDGHTITINSKSISNITPNTIPSTPNPGTNLKWSISANITIVKPSSGGTITWICSRTKELINTSDTNCYKGQSMPIDWTKAKVELNGSASGVNARGENFTAIATHLVRDFNCSPDPYHIHHHPFVSGTIAYTPGSRPTRTIDFGNGACDLSATVTINGHVFNVTLP